MMENRSSRQVFTDFYGEVKPKQNQAEVQAIESVGQVEREEYDLTANSELDIYRLFGSFTQFLWEFPVLFSCVTGEITRFVDTIEEQVASRELSQRFGQPISLLALPVAMQLANRESISKTDATQSAKELLINSKAVVEWFNNFLLIVKLQLLALEEEMANHSQARNEVSQTQVAETSVSQIKQRYLVKFDRKNQYDDQQKKMLETVIYWINGRIELLTTNLSAVTPIALQSNTASLVI